MRERPMSSQSARGALFGARAERLPPDAALRGGGSVSANAQRAAIQSTLEEDNNALVSDLERKVSALKHASMAIHDEVTDHNRMLSGMGADFERTAGMMTGALARVEGLLRGGGGQSHMCYIILFSVSVMLLLWWMMSKR